MLGYVNNCHVHLMLHVKADSAVVASHNASSCMELYVAKAANRLEMTAAFQQPVPHVLVRIATIPKYVVNN